MDLHNIQRNTNDIMKLEGKINKQGECLVMIKSKLEGVEASLKYTKWLLGFIATATVIEQLKNIFTLW